MAEDVKEGIVKVVVDRVANPLLFGFAISWCFINYQFFILVVKINDYGKLVKILKNDLFSDVVNYQFLWFDVSRCTYQGLLLPLWLSFLYTVFSPVLMVGVTWWQLFCESYLRKVKNYFDSNFSKTREEFDILSDDLSKLRDLKDAAENGRLVLQKKNDELEGQLKILLAEVSSLKASAEKMDKLNNDPKVLSRFLTGPGSGVNAVFGSVGELLDEYQNKYPVFRSDDARTIFKSMVRSGGAVTSRDLVTVGVGLLKCEHELEEFKSNGLVEGSNVTGYKLSERGRALGLAVENLLMQNKE